MRWLMGMAAVLMMGITSSAEPPLRIRVLESSGASVAEKRIIMHSRDPERPCLVLEPVDVLVLNNPEVAQGYWQQRFTGARLVSQLTWLRNHVRNWRGPFQFDLILPDEDM